MSVKFPNPDYGEVDEWPDLPSDLVLHVQINIY